ncbi:cytochrome d ubiquinol oxidase subunit II [Aquisalinus flavus]|uniref:Cytochrome d ubiquinol oxidase subunit II n=1 Tax=Aquisalinus flavus TaxID=1526572 RepID=A0A8J2V3G1_9PROT|nr:cytochrome d ubiquinol oxidase subunit II [Aquisalinus flavus]MBD0425889.1 cytochrome d ubiquinol oxidase subunit II [Aquisalinus flavus]UNE48515.1 cytochrome d ubiquinol oxidase subunit II [Aquisalinus flavus]GGD12455.1 cytochrome d ubiquinol oxidase subunit II [Aquisalinus flavus]
MLFDYEVLRLIWWALLGILLIGFAVTDGFDMGAAALMPFIGKRDEERRVIINTVGPVWEGNQVWFILGGGAIFAAWPALYALSFSGFYLAMFIVLFALILRPVAFKYRSKRDGAKWRRNWDWALFISGAVPPVIFGVAVGNAMVGVPFYYTDELRPMYEGTLFGLLNPAALFCGIVSIAMILMHGAAWIVLKTEGEIAARARRIGFYAALASVVLFALGGAILSFGWLGGYVLTSTADWAGPSYPLAKSVEVARGAWLANYMNVPLLAIVPALGFIGLAGAAVGFKTGGVERLTLLASGTGVAFIIATVGVTMFPFILPSTIMPDHSLMVFDASSSRNTLRNMLISVIIFLPLILGYTAWVFHVMRGKVTEDGIAKSSHAY